MRQGYFDRKMDDLTAHLTSMAQEVEELLESALSAIQDRDGATANAVILGDREIDAAEIEIEEACVELLALQQPVARDLRRLVAILKINNDLERVGDHAVNIAEAGQRLIEGGVGWSIPIELSEASTIARGMLRDALDAFVQRDTVKAREVCDRDDRVDRLHESLLRSMLTVMMESPDRIGASLDLILISRNVERVADLATNIGEDVVYLAEGQTIRHPDAARKSS